MNERVLIATHGDLDGIIAAFVLQKSYPTARLYFTQPFGLSRILSFASQYTAIYICDLPPNTQDPIQTLAILNHPAMRVWYDHHKGWDTLHLSDTLQKKVRVVEGAPSTVSLLPNVSPELVRMANLSDSGQSDQDSTVLFMDQALRADPRDIHIKYDLMAYLRLHQQVHAYEKMEQRTQAALIGGKKCGNILIIDLTEQPQEVDRVKLFFDGYRIAPYVAIISVHNGQKGITIGAEKDVDLPSVLGGKGVPHRVTIPYQDNYLQYLTEKLP